MGDDEGLGGLVGNDAFLTLKVLSELGGFFFLLGNIRYVTFFALRESSLDSIVMYFSPHIFVPLEMTDLGSDLSSKESAMAFISAALSYSLSVSCLAV